MARFEIDAAIRGGIERTGDDTGLAIAGTLFVLGVLNSVAAGAAATWSGARTGVPGGTGTTVLPMPFGLPPVVAGLVSLLAGIATVVVTIAALRVFVAGSSARVTREVFRRNILWAWLNVVVGGVLFGIAVGIGFLLLVVPGVFLLVSLVFWTVAVAVEDENFVEGFRTSWGLVRGHRWSLLGLGFVVLLASLVVSGIFGGIGVFVRGVVGVLIVQAGSALVTTFTIATLAHAYTHLRDIDRDESPTVSGTAMD